MSNIDDVLQRVTYQFVANEQRHATISLEDWHVIINCIRELGTFVENVNKALGRFDGKV